MDSYKKIYYCVFKCFCGCVFIVSPGPKPLLRPFAEVLMKVVLKPQWHFLQMQRCTAHHHWTLAVEVCSGLVWLCCVGCKVWCFRSFCSPETIVTGPHMSVSFCRVKFLIRQRIRVLFPTLGGPTTTITIGGGSRGVRSTTGTWCFLVFMSWALFEEQTKINTNTVWRHELDWLCNAQHWPVEGFGHADRRLNCKCFGVAFAFILLCWAILFLQLLLLCLWAAVLLLMLLLLLDFPIHPVYYTHRVFTVWLETVDREQVPLNL